MQKNYEQLISPKKDLANDQEILAVENVCVDNNTIKVLNMISFSVHAGEVIALMGTNGCGKTTLIKTCLGLIKPTHGKISVHPSTKISYVPQHISQMGTTPINVSEFIKSGIVTRNILSFKKTRDSFTKNITAMNLESKIHSPFSQLSGGQQRRVMIARAFISDADLYFMDEPLAGLDTEHQNIVVDTIKRKSTKQKTFIIATHNLASLEPAITRIIELSPNQTPTICCDCSVSKYHILRTNIYEHNQDHHHNITPGNEELLPPTTI